MTSDFSRSSKITYILMLMAIFSSCSTAENVVPTPEIKVFLQDSWNEYLSGQVLGADNKLFNIAIYGHIDGGWHNLPDKISPVTQIAENGSWTCQVQLDANSSLSKFSIHVLPNGYYPPILEGASTMPLKIHLVSAAKKTIHLN